MPFPTSLYIPAYAVFFSIAKLASKLYKTLALGLRLSVLERFFTTLFWIRILPFRTIPDHKDQWEGSVHNTQEYSQIF